MSHDLIVVANPTDLQRVEAMFSHLRVKRGMSSEMSLGDSNANGLRLLRDLLDDGDPYCFFDESDAESFGKDDFLIQPLFLSWGVMQDLVVDATIATISEEWLRCAEKIIAAGVLAGLHITWEGTARKRIAVQPSRVSAASPVFHSRN